MATWISVAFGDPDTSAVIETEGDRLFYVRLGGKDVHPEAGGQGRALRCLLWAEAGERNHVGGRRLGDYLCGVKFVVEPGPLGMKFEIIKIDVSPMPALVVHDANGDFLPELLLQIDAMVEPSPRSDEQEKPVEIVAGLLRAIAPVDVRQHEHGRELTSRILVVDDIAANRDLLDRRLTREGHQVVAVDNGAGALDLLLVENFDLILLDLMMPGMSGFEVAGALKDAPETANIPIVVLTSKEISADDRRELQSKVTSFVQKGKAAKEQLVREIKRLRRMTV